MSEHGSGLVLPAFDANTLALLQAVTESILILDAAGVILAANDFAARRLGRERREDIVGRVYTALSPPELAPKRRSRISEALRTALPLTYEDEDQELVQNHSLWPVTGPDGKAVRLIVFSRDITGRRRADEELRREQQRTIFLMETLPGFVYLINADHSVRYANRAFRRIFGRVSGRKCHEILCGIDAPCGFCPASRVFASLVPEEWELTHPDGRTFQAFGHPMTDIDGRVVLLVLGIDISARKKAEDALKQAQRYQRIILDHIPDLVWLMDAKGRFVAVNKAFEAFSECTLESVAGKTPAEVWGEEQAAGLRKHKEAAFERGESLTADELFVKCTGEKVWLEMTCIPALNEKGEVTGLTGIARDVTRHKEAVERLLYSHQELEGHVSDRTLALEAANLSLRKEIEERRRAEKKLLRAKKKAEIATRAKSSFLSNMSHEIRTPLNVILGAADMALDARDTGRAANNERLLRLIREAGGALLAEINDILDFSKIEANRLRLERVDFNFTRFMEGQKAVHGFTAEQKGLWFTMRVDQAIPRVLSGDPVRLGQICANLLSNAMKFTREGGIAFTAELVGEAPGRPAPGRKRRQIQPARLRFTVEDSGIGIAPDKLPLIFDSFQQADDSITREFGGTGLGLSISKRLVERMGGSLHVQSEPGKGSVFSFEAQLSVGDPSRVVRDEPTRGAGGEVQATRRLRALVVDDSAMNRELLTTFLQGLGHVATTAATGVEALAILGREAFDVVLMDIHMPEMDGETATKRIRAADSLVLDKNIAIIGLSARALPGDRERFLGAGMDDYLVKPIDLKALGRALTRLGEANDSESAGAEPATTVLPADESARCLGSRAEALALLQDDAPLLDRLDRVFMEHAPMDLADLRGAAARRDPVETHRIAHMLKGSARTIGASKTSELAMAIEDAASQGRTEDLDGSFAALAAELKATLSVLARMHAGRAASRATDE